MFGMPDETPNIGGGETQISGSNKSPIGGKDNSKSHFNNDPKAEINNSQDEIVLLSSSKHTPGFENLYMNNLSNNVNPNHNEMGISQQVVQETNITQSQNSNVQIYQDLSQPELQSQQQQQHQQLNLNPEVNSTNSKDIEFLTSTSFVGRNSSSHPQNSSDNVLGISHNIGLPQNEAVSNRASNLYSGDALSWQPSQNGNYMNQIYNQTHVQNPNPNHNKIHDQNQNYGLHTQNQNQQQCKSLLYPLLLFFFFFFQ